MPCWRKPKDWSMTSRRGRKSAKQHRMILMMIPILMLIQIPPVARTSTMTSFECRNRPCNSCKVCLLKCYSFLCDKPSPSLHMQIREHEGNMDLVATACGSACAEKE